MTSCSSSKLTVELKLDRLGRTQHNEAANGDSEDCFER